MSGRVFDRQSRTFKVDPNVKQERAVETKENQFLYEELGFPRPYSSITYEEDLIFTRYAKKYYTEESLQAVKEILELEMSSLSIGQIKHSLLFDLGNAVDTYQLAYLMLRYVRERGLTTSKLITSYDCQRAVLNYNTGSEWAENFTTDLAVIMINGGTPISYIQTLFQERTKQGKKTIMFLTNKANIKLALRDLAKTEANPQNATYIGLTNLNDLDYYEVLQKEVLESSKEDFKQLSFIENISMTTGEVESSSKREVGSKSKGGLSTNILEGTDFN